VGKRARRCSGGGGPPQNRRRQRREDAHHAGSGDRRGHGCRGRDGDCAVRDADGRLRSHRERAGVHYNSDRIKLQTKDPANIVTQAITYGPGSSSGWHSHVGIVVVTVKDGTVTRYGSDCVAHTYSQGDVFVETSQLGPIVLRNETALPAHLAATYITQPPVPQNLRIDEPNPGCAVG
jgi:quercetin dioxygenase-like cupin family protein